MSFRVIIEDLAASALAITTHGEDLAAAHSAADGRLEDAQSGWQGRSAVALTALAARWASEGRSVVAQMGEYADRLQDCARQYWAQDQGGSDALG
jgi:uncharacterized protein YukE